MKSILFAVALAACGGGGGTHADVDAAPLDGAADAAPDACVGVVDCAGTCNGSAVPSDCSGQCGTRTVDNCGVCDDDATNDCKWPDSTTDYCSTGTVAATCPSNPQGQDGDVHTHVPTYVTDANTVTDPVSGLVWQRKPPYTAITHANAVAYCDNLSLATQTDWRLPTRLELASLTDDGQVLPPLDHTAFTGVPQNSQFWTATAVANASGAHWAIGTNYPTWSGATDTMATGMIVRCVRGTAAFATGALAVVGGEVFDGRTNLMWQSDTAGTTLTWQGALAYCDGLAQGGHDDWRLPTEKELSSIVDDTVTNPAISTLFTVRPATSFWSSSAGANSTTEAYEVDFIQGAGSTGAAFTTKYDVRCVRP